MRIATLFAVFVLLAGEGFAVYLGMDKAELTQELGQPLSKMSRDGRAIWIYPKGVRIELEAGKVALVKGMEWSEGPAAAPPADAPVETPATEKTPPPATTGGADAKEKTAPKPEAARKAAAEKAAAEEARLEKQAAEADAKARAEMEKAIGQLEGLHDQPPAVHERVFDGLGFVLGLVIKCLLTLAAVCLSAKYWGAEIAWIGLLWVSGVDTGVRAIITLIGELLLQMPSLFYADEAVAAFVMVLMLRRVSYNRALAQAVQITLTTKTFSIVVGSFLVTVLLNLLH